ncbi:xylulokinase [Clostridium sp. E02]|uniref:xylulokinase n=1 Tax=Clostridium sp. E02 TaxID=2487134 RepID=UPI000F520DDB|nr:xylulokinase [Clostridium sp. E02]
MGPYLLGIDIGTSACKAAVFDKDGKVMAAANGEYGVYYKKPGWAEQDPMEWWMAVCSAVKEIFTQTGVRAEEIVGIGVAGQSWSAVSVDKEGEVLTNTPIWMDTRSKEICKEQNQKIGEDSIFRLSGNTLQPSYSTGKIIWYQKHMPQVYRKTAKILQSNSYIAFKLTGNMTQDLSQGYGLHCFDMHHGTWDLDMCRALSIDPDLLPDLYPSDEIIGHVTPAAAKETGLIAGIPVVAGGLDAACGTLGAGVIHGGETQEQGGQAGGMSICCDRCQADPRLILSYHVIPNRWLLQGGTTGGGGAMRWLEKEFGAHEREEGGKRGKCSLDLFNQQAERIAPGCDGLIFLPYMMGERSPIWNPQAKGVFYGLDFRKTKGHFIRSVMEGVAFSLLHNLDAAEEAGANVQVLKAMGGSANSLLWTQIKADITGKPVAVLSSDTSTTMGAAILAGVGVGMYLNYEEAIQLTVKNKRYHVPNAKNKQVYDENYGIYLKLYENLKELMNGKGDC